MYKVPYYYCCGRGQDITCRKRERGSNIIFPIILTLLRRISNGEEGKGRNILGEESQDFKTSGWGRISSCRELYKPLIKGLDTVSEVLVNGILVGTSSNMFRNSAIRIVSSSSSSIIHFSQHLVSYLISSIYLHLNGILVGTSSNMFRNSANGIIYSGSSFLIHFFHI